MARKRTGPKPIRIEALGLWYANIGPPDKNGRAKRVYAPKSIDTEAKAWAWLSERLAKVEAEKILGTDPTVFALTELWLAWSDRRASEGHITRKEYVNRCTHVALFREAAVGGRPVGGILAREFTSAELSAVVDGWRSRYSGQYVANVVRSIKAAWKWGSDRVAGRVPLRLLPEHTLASYRPPAVPRRVDRYVEPEVIRAFERWAWSRARSSAGYSRRFDRLFLLLFRFCRLTGARPGEACRLTWSMIDWRSRLIVIPPELHKTGKKTGRAREIQLTRPVLRLLEKIEALRGRHPEFVFTHRRGKGSALRGEVDPEAGEPWPDGSSASKRLLRLRRECIASGAVPGLEDVGPKRLVLYTARHVYASEALMAGLTSTDTAELLGNSAAMIESTYGHVTAEHRRRLAEFLADGKKARQ